MRYAFLVFLVTTSENRILIYNITRNLDYPYPFRHDFIILSQSKKHSIFLRMYERSAMSYDHMKYKAAGNTCKVSSTAQIIYLDAGILLLSICYTGLLEILHRTVLQYSLQSYDVNNRRAIRCKVTLAYKAYI